MKGSKKIVMLSLMASIFLTGCSIGGIKIIEKIESSSNQDNKVKTFEHAGYIFEQTEREMQTKTVAPAADTLDETGSIVRSLVIGEKVKIIGIDKTGEYAVFQDGESYLYLRMSDLEEVSVETPKETKEEIKKDKKNLETAISITKKWLSSIDRKNYREDVLVKFDEVLKKAELSMDNAEITQEEIDKVESELKLAKAELEKNKKPEKETVKETVIETPTEKETVIETPIETKEEPTPPQTGLGIEYPAAPDSLDIYGGVTFAILNNVSAEVVIPGSIYDSTAVGAKELAELKAGDKVKVLAIGTNDFARVETVDGKVGFIKSTNLKKN